MSFPWFVFAKSYYKIYEKYFKLNYKINFNELNSSTDLRLGFKYRNPLRNELLSLCSSFSSYTIEKYLKIPIKLGQTLTEDNIDATTDKHYISMANIKSLYLNTEMEITDISDSTILAENNSHGMNRFLLFNRYTGELNHTIKYANDNKLHTTGSYICKKVDKIL